MTNIDWKIRYDYSIAVLTAEIQRLREISMGDADHKLFIKPIVEYLVNLKRMMTAKPPEDSDDTSQAAA